MPTGDAAAIVARGRARRRVPGATGWRERTGICILDVVEHVRPTIDQGRPWDTQSFIYGIHRVIGSR